MRVGMLMMWLAAAACGAGELPDAPLTGALAGIDGQPIDLATFTGKVVLVVNVASRCGFTRQYADLQRLHETYAARGLVVLGAPCNQFGRQEPGAEPEIEAFCKQTYGVTFPMLAKLDVNGTNAPPLFRSLTSDQAPIADRGPVKWNFEKFLIDRRGILVARFRSRTSPLDPALVGALEGALGAAEPHAGPARPRPGM